MRIVKLTCNGHPRIPRYIRQRLAGGRRPRLLARRERIHNGAGRLMVELCSDGHGRGGGTHRASRCRYSRRGRPILMMMSQCIVDHGVCWRHITRQPSRIPARFIRGGIDGGCRRQCSTTGTRRAGREGTGYHGRGGSRVEGGRRHRLLLLVVVVSGGRHVRIHSAARRTGTTVWRRGATW